MSSLHVVVVGGGAAGFFAAITCAEANRDARVVVLEKGPQFLAKVRISGGGRCNVTHACFEPRRFAEQYPRGRRELLGPFRRFQARDTVNWFESRGVRLKTEDDGRMFPVTDSSRTVIDCLVQAAEASGVTLVPNRGVEQVTRHPERGFELRLSNGERVECDRLLLATGGCRSLLLGGLATSLGHTLAPPVPSLFTFHVEAPGLRDLAGVSVESVEVQAPATGLRARGALLVTHWGVSGPVILKLSAWGARELHAADYHFPLQVNWLPESTEEEIAAELDARRVSQAARLVVNAPLVPLPARLWEHLVLAAGLPRETRWAALSRTLRHRLVQHLTRTVLPVTGKSLNKDEFVTCGGVRLSEVNFSTMESRLCPGLYLAGELLDIDGLTGGFNFQAAWTTGWIAGKAMAA